MFINLNLFITITYYLNEDSKAAHENCSISTGNITCWLSESTFILKNKHPNKKLEENKFCGGSVSSTRQNWGGRTANA
jgi:hypothetical protein